MTKLTHYACLLKISNKTSLFKIFEFHFKNKKY